jgi:hypothetical protein
VVWSSGLYDIPFSAWVTFTYIDPKLLTIKIVTRWGEEVKYPACNTPLRRLLDRVGFDIVADSSELSTYTLSRVPSGTLDRT